MTDDPTPFTPDEPEITELAARLSHERPVPSAAFRSTLHQRLLALEATNPFSTRPSHLWTRIVLLAGSGATLLALIGAGVAGSGPFAP
jgi:hypothetical protein